MKPSTILPTTQLTGQIHTQAASIAGLALLLARHVGLAEVTSTNAPDVFPLAPMIVAGAAVVETTAVGSAALITSQQIRNQTYANPNRVFQQLPGVYVRDEDGYGNFPNISLRGTDSVRSAKTTLMEDGVLMSPAPYTFPAAYHSPRIGRMSGSMFSRDRPSFATDLTPPAARSNTCPLPSSRYPRELPRLPRQARAT